jgi:hypothetical protein
MDRGQPCGWLGISVARVVMADDVERRRIGCARTSRRSVSRARRTAGESRRTVLVALAANVAVLVAKLGGGLISGSAAMLAEAAHSMADATNQSCLLVSIAADPSRGRARSRCAAADCALSRGTAHSSMHGYIASHGPGDARFPSARFMCGTNGRPARSATPRLVRGPGIKHDGKSRCQTRHRMMS